MFTSTLIFIAAANHFFGLTFWLITAEFPNSDGVSWWVNGILMLSQAQVSGTMFVLMWVDLTSIRSKAKLSHLGSCRHMQLGLVWSGSGPWQTAWSTPGSRLWWCSPWPRRSPDLQWEEKGNCLKIDIEQSNYWMFIFCVVVDAPCQK